MKILMDIFANWRKGKKAHDERVPFLQSVDLTPARIQHARRILSYIEGCMVDTWPMPVSVRELEAKQWQILAEYAQDQVKALTKVKSDVLPTEESNAKSTFDPLQDQYIAIWGRTASLGSSESKSILDKAEERHGFTMSKE